MNKRAEFIKTVLTLVDDPWAKVGSTRSGMNCLGVVVCAAREMGGFEELVTLGEEQAMFARPLTPRMMVDGILGHMTPLPPAKAIPGDLLLFRITGRPDHIVVVVTINPLQFVHSDRDHRKVRKTTLPAGWLPIGAFRIEDLDSD